MIDVDDRLSKQIEFIIEVDKLKNVFRQNLLMDKSRYENDAEHSWHFAMMAIILYEYANPAEVNILRVLKMATIHDLVEIYAGDTFAHDVIGNLDKEEREEKAAVRLFSLLPKDQGDEIYALWKEFDQMKTPDAKFAAAMDRLASFIAISNTDGFTWQKHGVDSSKVYKRIEIVKEISPVLWDFVEHSINSSIDKKILIK